MERDLTIGNVEFSNPSRTDTYMRKHPNRCYSGSVAPCQCTPGIVYTDGTISASLDGSAPIQDPAFPEDPNRVFWGGQVVNEDVAPIYLSGVYSILFGTYTIGTDPPCPPPTIPTIDDPDWGLDTPGTGTFPIDLDRQMDLAPDILERGCYLRRFAVVAADGTTLIGYMYFIDQIDPEHYWIAYHNGTDSSGAAWFDLSTGMVSWGLQIPTGVGGAGTVYTSPAADNAPWFDPADPRSADFLGVWLDDLVLSSPHTRTAQNRQWGGSLSAIKYGRRELTIGGRLYVRNKAAAAYAEQWAYEALVDTACGEQGCVLPDVQMLSYCDTDDPTMGIRYLHEVGLVDWQTVLDTTEPRDCFVSFTATLASKIPWLTKAPQTVYTGAVISSAAFCDICGNMIDGDTACEPRVVVDPLALQCGCTDSPARAIPTAQRAECYVRPMYVARKYVAISNAKRWTDGALKFTIVGGVDGVTPGTPSLKNLRIRAYLNPDNLDVSAGDTLLCGSDPVADVQIGCIPYGSTMVIDGSRRRASVSIEGLTRSANPYLSSGGGKFTFPEYSCGRIMLAIDSDGMQTANDSTITIQTIEIERG